MSSSRKRDPLREKFRDQKKGAKRRGIEWKFTFEEWLRIWQGSGHLHERGRRAGQYQMARNGDVGPYSIDNVKIITADKNRTEYFELRNNGTMREVYAQRREMNERRRESRRRERRVWRLLTAGEILTGIERAAI